MINSTFLQNLDIVIILAPVFGTFLKEPRSPCPLEEAQERINLQVVRYSLHDGVENSWNIVNRNHRQYQESPQPGVKREVDLQPGRRISAESLIVGHVAKLVVEEAEGCRWRKETSIFQE